MDDRPIGIFDSGAGGLTVLHECLVTLPHEDFLYLGDGARCPYGPRPAEEVRRFALEIATYLERRGVKLIAAACNTATAVALPLLQERIAVPIVGVLTPEAHAAVQATRNRRIGVLATAGTVESGRYADVIHALDAGATVTQIACPSLVPLIEANVATEELVAAVREYAAPLKAAEVDTVVLGCTHYPLIRPLFERVFGRSTTLVFSADETAREVAETLARKGIGNDPAPRGIDRVPHDGQAGRLRRCSASASSSFRSARFARSPWASSRWRRRDPRRPRRQTSCARSRSSPATWRTHDGSALISVGATRVLCTATVEEGVPRWLESKGEGWLTAEYGMLPASAGQRIRREASAGRQKGRTVEIQRLIGRAIRGGYDLRDLGERTLWLDCDVLQADGGTRTAAVTGAWVALVLAARKVGFTEPAEQIAAVSLGIVDGRASPRPRLRGGLRRGRGHERGHDRRRGG